jgi:hypothetical protein
MHIPRLVSASLAATLLAACGDSTGSSQPARATSTSIAGGETSEFSGGSTPLGYCPVILSRTALDLARDDVTPWTDLAAGHHDVALRWRRAVPDDTIRGFDVDTRLSIDVVPVAAEELLCNNGDYSYQPEGLERWRSRRFDLAIELSTADGAIRMSFQSVFHTLSGERGLLGEAILPFADNAGALELGLDPSLPLDSQALYIWLQFSEQGTFGAITSRVTLPAADVTDAASFYDPIAAEFPAPDVGCNEGRSVPLDTHQSEFGATPRGAYEAALSLLPSAPLDAAWFAPNQPSVALAWTDVTLTAGAPERACFHDSWLMVYTSLHIESADGGAAGELPVIARLFRILPEDHAGLAVRIDMRAAENWTASAEFMASGVVRDVQLGEAEYAAQQLYATAVDVDRDQEELRGELAVQKWQDYAASRVDQPVLRWCGGLACERDSWCFGAAPGDGSSCPRPPQ